MGTLRISHIKKTIREMNIPHRLRMEIEKKEMSMRRLSLSLGLSQSFLNAKQKKHEFSCAEIMAHSNYLDTNLFEWFSDRLPANIQPTKKEIELFQQVADLQKQISDLEKEKELLKEILQKK